MIRTIELPQVGESVTEGVIGKWLVEPGQHVEKYDPLVEVVTDKVSMEAPSPYTGTFVRALAEEGETVPMGQPICEMDVEGEEPSAVPAEARAERATSQPDPVDPTEGEASDPDPVIPAQAGIQGARAVHEEGSGAVGDVPTPDSLPLENEDEGEPEAAEPADEDPGRVGGAWAMPASSADEPQPEEAAQPAFEFMDSVRSVGPTGSGERGEGRPDALQDEAIAEHAHDSAHETAAPSAAEPDRRHVISPLVARLSAQYGIDLSTLQGTGTGGRITSKDLLEAVGRMSAGTQQQSATPPAAPAESPESAADAPEPQAEMPEPAPEVESGAPEDAAAPDPLSLQGERAGVRVPPDEPEEAAPAEEELEEVAVDAPLAEAAPEEESVEVVEEALDEAEEEAELSVAPEPDTSVMPLTPVRRIIAEHMARSSREIPAAWSLVEVDVTRLVRARDALKAAFEAQHGVPLTYLPFAAAAVAAALREHPRLNARWDEGHITLNNHVNLAVAVSTEAGLMVPVLRDADTLTIAAIAAELHRLSGGARAGTLSIGDVQGGTFTLNNTGALGSVVSVPIINHPQAAILTTEAIVKRPVVVEGDAIAVRSMMNLCITFDHRICDGAEASAFLTAVKARLEAIDNTIELE